MALLTGPLAVCSVCCSTSKISEDGNYRVDTQRTRQRRRLKFDSSRVVGLLGLQLLVYHGSREVFLAQCKSSRGVVPRAWTLQASHVVILC